MLDRAVQEITFGRRRRGRGIKVPRIAVRCVMCDATFLSSPHQPKRKFCSHLCFGRHRQQQREQRLGFGKDWLVQKYLVEGLSYRQIGKLVNRSYQAVSGWLKQYHIEARRDGEENG